MNYLRIVTSVVGLLFFCSMAFLYLADTALYITVLKAAGINPWGYPFIDSEFMYVMKASWLKGINIYQAVPDDVVPGNHMVYSPLWPRLPFLPTDKAVTVPVAVVTDVALLLAVSILPPAKTWRDVMLMSLAITSTMVVYAMERNNVDVWIFVMTVIGGQLLSKSAISRAFAYTIFVLLGLLKYYPFTLLGLAAMERPRRAIAIGAISAIVLTMFTLFFWDEIRQQLQGIPSGWPGSDMVGIVNMPRTIANQFSSVVTPDIRLHNAVEWILRLMLTATVIAWGARLAASDGLKRALSALDRQSTIWLLIGCLLMVGCLLSGQSIGYRGVHMLFVLSGLLALLRVTADRTTTRTLWISIIMIVILMWMEGIRFWTARSVEALHLPYMLGRSIEVGVWLARELMWLNVERVMIALILVVLRRSPTMTWLRLVTTRVPSSTI